MVRVLVFWVKIRLGAGNLVWGVLLIRVLTGSRSRVDRSKKGVDWVIFLEDVGFCLAFGLWGLLD